MKITQRMKDQARMIADAKVGQELEFYAQCESEWSAQFSCVYFDNGNMDYRIKPEPRTIWVNEYVPGYAGAAHDSEEAARHLAFPGALRIAVEYREVVK
jgi:hypothetical protein